MRRRLSEHGSRVARMSGRESDQPAPDVSPRHRDFGSLLCASGLQRDSGCRGIAARSAWTIMTFDPTHLRQLKDRLPCAWDALFARFGAFTEIQSQAIEPLLEGRNCVLVSATASGKTEAALAPLLERHKQSSPSKSPKKLSILYIVPTRALARDLARRLQLPLEKLAVRMQVKTGDEPTLNSNRPPELLLTTPESFDSLLANRPRMAKDIGAVVIDELHIFDGSVRGDQLRILLNRQRRIKRYAFERGEIARNELQFCALSATIRNPSEAGSRYFTDP